MWCMQVPVNISISVSADDLYGMQKQMDLGKSSRPNISVKQQKEEYSLKKETYSASSDDCDDDLSNKPKEKKTPSTIKAVSLRPYDVLCGRDKATFNNIGNRRFRVSISLNIPRYNAAKTKAQKASVIKFVCDFLQNEVGVRFLRKQNPKDDGSDYIELNRSEARKKVGHALRDMSVAKQQLQEKRKSFRTVGRKRDNDDVNRRRTWPGGTNNKDDASIIRPETEKKDESSSLASLFANNDTNRSLEETILEPLPIDEQHVRVGRFGDSQTTGSTLPFEQHRSEFQDRQQRFRQLQNQHLRQQHNQHSVDPSPMSELAQLEQQQNEIFYQLRQQQQELMLHQQQHELLQERDRLRRQQQQQQQQQQQLQQQQQQQQNDSHHDVFAMQSQQNLGQRWQQNGNQNEFWRS